MDLVFLQCHLVPPRLIEFFFYVMYFCNGSSKYSVFTVGTYLRTYFLVDYLLLVYQGLCNLSLSFTIQLDMS